RHHLKETADRPSDAPLCEYFRQNAHLFYSDSSRDQQGRPRIAISGLTTLAADLDGPKNARDPDTGFVIVIFHEKAKDESVVTQVVRFIIERGKIHAEMITPGGRFGQMIGAQVLPEPPPGEPHPEPLRNVPGARTIEPGSVEE